MRDHNAPGPQELPYCTLNKFPLVRASDAISYPTDATPIHDGEVVGSSYFQ
mgnify:FL=1|jgi:hypothetical protein